MNTYFDEIKNIMTTTVGYVPHVIIVYSLPCITHYVSSNVYPMLCTPLTLTGFIMAPFIVVTPHCQGLRWVIHYTGDQIRHTWVWVGTYLVYYITKYITPYFVQSENTNTNDHEKDE